MAKPKIEQKKAIYGAVIRLDIKSIEADPNQPRKEFNDTDLQDLSESIKKLGLLQPIAVHKAPDEIIFKLIYGERRLRASQLAGLEEIPCIIFDKLDDNTVLEMQIIENMQRKNINSMEESDAFQQLISRGIDTPEQIADKLGTSTKYVYDRLILQRVIAEVQDAVRNNRLTITHAKQFARLPHFEQMKLWEEVCDDETLTVADLRENISDTFKLKLDAAPFDIKDAKLVKKAGACIKCTKRSGCNLVLFDYVKQDDICFDAECWESKENANIEQVIERLKAEGKEVKLLSTQYSTNKPNVLNSHSWDDTEEETGIVGVFVERQTCSEYQIGQVVNLLPDEDEETEKAPTTGATPKAKSGPSDYDLIEELGQDTIVNICKKYTTNPNKFPAYDTLLVIKNMITSDFNYLNDENCEKVCNLLKIAIKIEDEEPDYKESILEFIESMSITELSRVLFMVKLINDAESLSVDQDEFNELNTKLKAISIDMLPKLHSLEKIAGRTLIQFTT